MPLSVENLCGLVIRSRLHQADDVKAFYQRWQGEAADKRNVRGFARWLVSQRHLTPYQATLLSNGYADNFFLGNYKILDRIGKGRMAGVYKAVHPSGQVVAIKVLPPSKAKDPQILARFQREAKMATQFNHVSVVRAFHYAEANGLHFLVMEHLDGITLKDFLKTRGRMTPKEVARIGFLVALGLQHLHDKGVVHRDVKPSNLMLCPAPPPGENTLRSMIKLLDIGLGRQFARISNQADLTTPGLVLGTPEYLAPEQAKDARKADGRADLYALGCSLYHALAGRPPFIETSPMQQIVRHATTEPPTFAELKVDVPEELAAIVRKLMAKDPNQRLQTPAKVAEAIRKYLGNEADANKADTTLPSYLEEIKKPQEAEKPARVATNSPFPVPDSPKRTSLPPPTVEKVLQSKRRRRSHLDKPVILPVPMPSAKLAPGSKQSAADVELVPTNDLPHAPLGLPIPRDLFMIGVGAFGVLGVALVLWLVRFLFGGRP